MKKIARAPVCRNLQSETANKMQEFIRISSPPRSATPLPNQFGRLFALAKRWQIYTLDTSQRPAGGGGALVFPA